MTVRDTILQIAPRRLRRYWGSRVMYPLGLLLDAVVTLLADSLRARYPDYAPPDALAAIGRDRQIDRGFDESASGYAARLKQWLATRTRRGSAHVLMTQLAGYLSPHAVRLRVVNNAGAWHTRQHDGEIEYHDGEGNWDWDGDAASWSRYWVVLYPQTSLMVQDGTWGMPGKWGTPGGKWGCDIGAEQARTIAAIVRRETPPHARCEGLIVTWDLLHALDPADDGTAYGWPRGEWAHAGVDVAGCYTLVRPLTMLFTGPL
jgi:hypothetical protein